MHKVSKTRLFLCVGNIINENRLYLRKLSESVETFSMRELPST